MTKVGAIVFPYLAAVAILFAAWWVIRRLLRAALRVRLEPGVAGTVRQRVLLRYQYQAFHPWMFAWFKTRLDPMFSELPEILKAMPDVRVFLDLGCGFGVAGSYLLEWFGGARIYAVEPSAGRVGAAAKAFGERGNVFQGAAPDFEQSEFPEKFDAVFALDMIHFLSDSALDLTLRRIRNRLQAGDYLVIRAPMQPLGFGSLIWNVDRIHRMVTGAYTYFRSVEQVRARIEAGGFEIGRSGMSGNNPELYWFICVASVAARNQRKSVQPVATPSQQNGEHQ